MKLSQAGFAHFAAVITILIWGTTFIATKFLLQSFSPIEILFLRFALGFAVLCGLPGRLPYNSFRQEMLFAAAGLCGVTLYFLFENIALQYTLASNVGILVTISPFFTALLSCFLLKNEHLTGRFFLGFVTALFGIVLISYNGSVALQLNPLGDILAILAAATWSVYSILMKRIGQLGKPMALCTRRTFFYGLLFMLPALGWFGFAPSWEKFLEPVNAFNLLFLGFGASAICFATWNWAVKILGAIKTSVYIYLVPAVTVTASVLLLHEPLTYPALGGIALILLGLILSERKSGAS